MYGIWTKNGIIKWTALGFWHWQITLIKISVIHVYGSNRTNMTLVDAQLVNVAKLEFCFSPVRANMEI